GIREFIIGTGGESLDTVVPPKSASNPNGTPNLQAYTDQFYGVMKFKLFSDGYSWDYQSALRNPSAPTGTPSSYSDSGFGTCNGPGVYCHTCDGLGPARPPARPPGAARAAPCPPGGRKRGGADR